MAKTIYKYKIDITRVQSIEMPDAPKPLCFQVQDGEPTLWAEVDTDKSATFQRFFLIGTGHDFPAHQIKYIGTIQKDGLVWHFIP